MNSLPKVGLVTVLYNSAGVLPAFFQSLRAQTYQNIILYVIDNSPDDASLDCARHHSTYLQHVVRFVRNVQNYGVAKGNNQGIELALEDRCDYILLLNNDIEFSAETLSNMIDFALTAKAEIVVPKIYYHGTNQLWYAGGKMRLLLGTGRHRGDRCIDSGQFDRVEAVSYAPTCFLMISNNVFRDIGLMDEKFFLYFDDTDFVYRANKLYKIIYNPNCIVYHKVSFSSGGVNEDRTKQRFWRRSVRLPLNRFAFSGYLTIRNNVYFINKNYKTAFKYYVMFLAVLRQLVGIILYDDFKAKRMRLACAAFRDGYAGRMGKPKALIQNE